MRKSKSSPNKTDGTKLAKEPAEISPNTLITKMFRLLPTQKQALSRLKIETAQDLLMYFPTSYSEPSTIKTVATLEDGETATLYGTITSINTKSSFRGKIPMAFGSFGDETGSIKLAWFNQAYIARMLPEGSLVAITGTVKAEQKSDGKIVFNMTNPETEKLQELPAIALDAATNALFNAEELNSTTARGVITATYPETRGITSKWMRYAIKKILASHALEQIQDPLPQHILEKYHLPNIRTALIWLHIPRTHNDKDAARKRFAFEEVFCIQIQKQRDRTHYKHEHAWSIDVDLNEVNQFASHFGFPLTQGQKRIVGDIARDMSKSFPMSRLLEGDVGSGKTAVAALATYMTVMTAPRESASARLQVAYMCPTEILAKQHFNSFMNYFSRAHTGARIHVGLITSSGCFKYPSKTGAINGKELPTPLSRTQFLKYVAQGEINVVIGTHSLLADTVRFKHLGLVIIDEQHRFGTNQRQKLARKHHHIPHLLSMTATPIPRTLALTLYGDLDISILDELPQGRKPIQTYIIEERDRQKMYKALKEQVALGRQIYVICPRIDEPDKDRELVLEAKSVKQEAARLKKEVFPTLSIDILHGKQSAKIKDETMMRFEQKKIDVLVATSVVEVGVNVPNATAIVIEGGERFGLSQLHQLRGRVQRSSHQAYCYICADTKNEKSIERLKAITEAKNGFELAEYDLGLRGAGELYGVRQWGVSDLAMEAIKNIKLVEIARDEARILVEQDIDIQKYPILKDRIFSGDQAIHFE